MAGSWRCRHSSGYCAGIGRNGSIEYDDGQVFASQTTNNEYVVVEYDRPRPLSNEIYQSGANQLLVRLTWENLAATVPGHLDYLFQLFNASGQLIGSSWTQQNGIGFYTVPGQSYMFRIIAGDNKDRFYAIGDVYNLTMPRLNSSGSIFSAASALSLNASADCVSCEPMVAFSDEAAFVEALDVKVSGELLERGADFSKASSVKADGFDITAKAEKKTMSLSKSVMPERVKVNAGKFADR